MSSTATVARQHWRFGLALAVFAILYGVVAWRLHILTIEQGQELAERGRRQSTSTWTIPAARGSLVDAQGTPLVESLGTWTLTCDPLFMEDKAGACVGLAKATGLGRDHFRAQFESGSNGRVLARGLEDATAAAIKGLRLGGVYLRREFTRTYHHDRLAAHVLGFLQADGSGGAGIERQFHSQLTGINGSETVTRDAKGRPVLTGFDAKQAQAGANLQLTIDLTIQRSLETHLKAAIEKHAPHGAAGLVVRPASGEIVALASWPDFDPQTRDGLSGEALRNNPLQFVYEPGSTFKPLIAGAAVEERLASFSETIFCERGRWTYREGRAVRTISDHSLKHGGHGNLSVTQGIALSDNILMAKLGIRLGPERLKAWVARLSFGARTGISLPGEEPGIVPGGNWKNINEGMSIPMGHNIAVTPLQLSMAHAAVANGGVWKPPRLVKRIWRNELDGSVSELPLPPLGADRRMYATADADAIEEAMTHTMTEGTAKGATLDGYTSAGKTGTAEKLINGRYSKQHHVGSFICWAPADASGIAELLCLVVIDNPTRNGHYGGETAGPVVQAVLQEGLEYLRVPKKPELLKQPKDADSVAVLPARGRR